MTHCAKCTDHVDMPYECNYCGRLHCSSHRLPENHNCTGLTSNPHSSVSATSSNSVQFPVDSSGSTSVASSSGNSGSLLGGLVKFGLILAAVYVIYIAAAPVVGMADLGFLNEGDSAKVASQNNTQTITATATETPESGLGNSTETERSEDRFEPNVQPLNESKIEYQIHKRINQRRAQHAQSSLTHDGELRKIAGSYSDYMAKHDHFAHSSLNGSTFSDRYARHDYDCRVDTGDGTYYTGAENIFKMSWSQRTYSNEEVAEEAVEGWMNSTGHRENILTEDWNNEGIGVNVSTDGFEKQIYVTQNFC